MRRCLAPFSVILILAVSPIASAQTGTKKAAATAATIDDLYVDFAIPDLPGIGLLGLNPSGVTKPGNLKELSLSLLGASGPSVGGIQPGVAVAWAPAYTFHSSVDDYRRGFLRRLAVSFATVKGETATEIGLGARFVVIDRSDPLASDEFRSRIDTLLTSFVKALAVSDRPNQQMLQQALPILMEVAALHTTEAGVRVKLADLLLAVWNSNRPPDPLTAEGQLARFDRHLKETLQKEGLPPVAIGDALQKRIEALADEYEHVSLREGLTADQFRQLANVQLLKAKTQFRQDHWNAPVVHVDGGAVFESPDSTWEGLRASRIGAIAAGSFPLGRSAQIIAQAQGRRGTGETPVEDWFYSFGGRLLAGSATSRLSLEFLRSDARSTEADKNGSRSRFTAGTEVRLSEGFWLEIAVGTESRPGTGTDGRRSVLSLANLKYAFKSAPRFTQIPGHGEAQ